MGPEMLGLNQQDERLLARACVCEKMGLSVCPLIFGRLILATYGKVMIIRFPPLLIGFLNLSVDNGILCNKKNYLVNSATVLKHIAEVWPYEVKMLCIVRTCPRR